MSVGVCKSCGAEIEWALTGEGHRIPLDRVPVRDGNIMYDYDREAVEVRPGELPAQRRLIARVLTKPELERLRGGALPGLEPKLYKSHFATCPQSKQWKKPRKRKTDS